MTYFQRSWAQIVLLLLSLFGIVVSIYLTISHYDKVPVVCSSSGLVNCERVLSSAYSVVPGTSIPISVPGLLWFLVFGVIAFLAWRIWPERRALVIGEVVWSVVGLITALYLVFVEFAFLHNICAWCTSLHAAILVMLLISVYQLLRLNEDEYDDFDGEAVPEELPQISE